VTPTPSSTQPRWISALPDRSVTETLSRIPGVTIDHFPSVGDPEHFSAEGSGVQVRGLTQVRSELNGRDSFPHPAVAPELQDVPSGLLSGVAYTRTTRPTVEGRPAGPHLRTFMPFDFDGQRIAASFSENYGDFVENTSLPPRLYSNT
jgi:hypothetical protein